MTREEHLNKILAKLDTLIEGAKKRTQGKWRLTVGCVKAGDAVVAYPPRMTDTLPSGGINDGEFIASCAGPAEAGWIATRAAIVALRAMALHPLTAGVERALASDTLDTIIAAWPEEIL